MDLRFALRLVKDRWFSVVAITAWPWARRQRDGLHAGQRHRIRGLPFPEADRLYVLGVKRQTSTGGGEPISRPDLLDWRAGTKSYEGLAGFVRGSMTVSDARTSPEDTPGVWITANAFDLLRQPMLFGRSFRTGDDEPGAERVVILGHALWQSRYRGDRGVLGLPIRVNGEPGTVIGVMPPGIKFPTNAELWVSAIPLPEQIARRDIRNFTVFARLRPGVTFAQAQAELASSSASRRPIRPATRSSPSASSRPSTSASTPARSASSS